MVAVIGDVHGCYFTMETLYSEILKKFPGIEVYCVGDLVDRGKGSYDVVEFFIRHNIKFTPGNHDLMFYDYFKNPDTLFAKSWVHNGSDSTLYSYLNRVQDIGVHLDYIGASPLFYNLEDCFISHAGISARYKSVLPENFGDDLNKLALLIHAEKNSESGVMWNRDKLLNLGKLQVVGHTIQKEIKVDNKAKAIYIDTGACANNKLSAVIIHNSEVVDVLFERTHPEDI